MAGSLEKTKMEVANILLTAMREIGTFHKLTAASLYAYICEEYPDTTLEEIDTIYKMLLDAVTEKVEVSSDSSSEVVQAKRKGRKRKRPAPKANKKQNKKAKRPRRRAAKSESDEDDDDSEDD